MTGALASFPTSAIAATITWLHCGKVVRCVTVAKADPAFALVIGLTLLVIGF